MSRPKKVKTEKFISIGCSMAPTDKAIFDAVQDYMREHTWHDVTNAFTIRECIIRTALDCGIIKRNKDGVYKFANKTISPALQTDEISIAQDDA